MRIATLLLACLLVTSGCDKSASSEATPPAAQAAPQAPKPSKDGKASATAPVDTKLDAKPEAGGADDRAALEQRSRNLLEALKAKNIDEIVRFMPKANREDAKAAFAEGGESAKAYFGQVKWRWKAISGWNGKLQEMRRDGDRAQVKFADVDGKEAAVLYWHKADEKWWFDELNSPPLADFAKFGRKME